MLSIIDFFDNTHVVRMSDLNKISPGVVTGLEMYDCTGVTVHGMRVFDVIADFTFKGIDIENVSAQTIGVLTEGMLATTLCSSF